MLIYSIRYTSIISSKLSKFISLRLKINLSMKGKLTLSSVVKKFIIAITGGFMVLFLTFHGVMNVVAIFSAESYQMICDFLGANWYAVIGSLLIAFFVALHFIMAFVLSWQNYVARGRQRYAIPNNAVTWDVRNMIVIGLLVIGGLTLHLYDFWYTMQFAELCGREPASGVERIRFVFGNTYFAICYLAWLGVLFLHLAHGVPSIMQSLGWNNKKWIRRIDILGKLFALAIVGLFAIVVVYFWIISRI